MLSSEQRRDLENLLPGDVVLPNEAVLTYAVCTLDTGACGWGGWMLEAAYVDSASAVSEPFRGREMLPALTRQVCPNCGGGLFRTDTAQHLSRRKDLVQAKEGGPENSA